MQSSVHAPAGGDAVHSAHRDLPSDSGWHVYLLDWSASGMSFSRDVERYLTVGREFCPASAWAYGPRAPDNGGMFLLLNLAVGGSVGNPACRCQLPGRSDG